MESKAVTPSETFSVFSPVVECGVKKPTIVTTVMNADGITKLNAYSGIKQTIEDGHKKFEMTVKLPKMTRFFQSREGMLKKKCSLEYSNGFFGYSQCKPATPKEESD